jgi:hypothetical protein
VLHTLVRGGQFDPAFGLVNGPVKPRSNLVNLRVKLGLGQSSPNSGKCIPDHVLRVFGYSGPQSGQKRLGQTSVKLGQLSQTWSTLGKLGRISGNVTLDHVLMSG